jgi:hypothetical protein
VGHQGGYNLTTGSGNAFFGSTISGSYGSGFYMTTGSKNVILGSYSGNQGGLDIRTSSNNIVLSDGDGNPRGIFDSNGKLLVGRTSALNTSQVSVQAYNNSICIETNTSGGTYYPMWFYNSSGTVVGYIQSTASATTYATTSDYRLKENVVAMSGATERLKQLNPVRFNFIADADTTVDGFLAHEAQAVVPEAVTGEKDAVDADGNPEYQGIDQSKLVPLLVATIQELEARITALESA